MKLDKQDMQNELDKAAMALEKAGFKDLAERVDYYCNRLMAAQATEVPLIKRALSRVREEARKRIVASSKRPEPRSKESVKAEAAVSRTSLARRLALRKRIRELVASRKRVAKEMDRISPRREAVSRMDKVRQERLARIRARQEQDVKEEDRPSLRARLVQRKKQRTQS
jgi:hypothetical protein